jgi:hypothetical protein
MNIDYLKVNQKLYDTMWNPLKVLAIKRNSMIEDETGQHKFKKITGKHRCIHCKAWTDEAKTVKHKNNYYCIEHEPKKDRSGNRIGLSIDVRR